MSETELYLHCLEFVREQSGGEWGDDLERQDAAKLAQFVRRMANLSDAPDPQHPGGEG